MVLFLAFLEIHPFKLRGKNPLALCFSGWIWMTAPDSLPSEGRAFAIRPQAERIARSPYLLVTEARHLVHKFLLDHEGSQIGCVAGQEYDGKEGPHGHHDLAGGAFRILDRHGVVEHQAPKEPYSFSNRKRRPVGCCKRQKGHSQQLPKMRVFNNYSMAAGSC